VKTHAQQGHSRGAELLVSILVRYPELGTLTIDPETASLRLTVLVARALSEGEQRELSARIIESLDALFTLTQVTPLKKEVSVVAERSVTAISVTRDITSISREEFALIVGLLRELFPNHLFVDRTQETFVDEDLELQEDYIEEMLENLRAESVSTNLYAFREGGRVLVFNK